MTMNRKHNREHRAPAGAEEAGGVSEKLMSQETQDAMKMVEDYRMILALVTDEICEVLIKHDLNWKDFGEIVQMMNAMNSYVAPRITIAELKRRTIDDTDEAQPATEPEEVTPAGEGAQPGPTLEEYTQKADDQDTTTDGNESTTGRDTADPEDGATAGTTDGGAVGSEA